TPFQTNRLGERNHEKGSARQLGKFACEWSVRWSVDQKTIRIVNVTQGSIALTNVEQFSDRSNTSIRRIEAFKNHHDFFPLQRGEDFIKVAWIIMAKSKHLLPIRQTFNRLPQTPITVAVKHKNGILVINHTIAIQIIRATHRMNKALIGQ